VPACRGTPDRSRPEHRGPDRVGTEGGKCTHRAQHVTLAGRHEDSAARARRETIVLRGNWSPLSSPHCLGQTRPGRSSIVG
jgi:hypothetical protein